MGCGHSELGITALKEHMEVGHGGVKVEDWDNKKENMKFMKHSVSPVVLIAVDSKNPADLDRLVETESLKLGSALSLCTINFKCII